MSRPLSYAAIALWCAGVALLLVELRRRKVRGLAVGATGVLAATLAVLSALRPVFVLSKGSLVGAKVVVLADRSRSMDLPVDGTTRRDVMRSAVAKLRAAAGPTRLSVLGFGDGPATAWDETGSGVERPAGRSDLAAALASLSSAPGERPAAVIVLSDGRLDRPADDRESTIRQAIRGIDAPIHTVGFTSAALADASVRAVRVAGAAVAHQPLPLTVQVGCDGGIACGDLAVSARELIEGGAPALLASGTAHLEHGTATVELGITLDRAGARIVEVGVQMPDGDRIPDNNSRLLRFDVARDRVRILHIAGRPTYDVRALRTWLKADASVDVVAYFILRTATDDVNASDDELALIPFPVHELFTEHLSSFDAVVLQDFNAAPYELVRHLPALAAYVEHGGGLIMVGGPDSFVGGHYAGTRLSDVLPVALPEDPAVSAFDLAPFVPAYTEVARTVPILRPVRSLLGDALPEMAGANRIDDARPGTFVLWAHPRLRTRSGAKMPVLALGEKGDGRTIALAVDSTYRLAYSVFASETGGRAHGALWDGLVGWLMRDPRFEPAELELQSACMAGVPLSLKVRPLPGSRGNLNVEISNLGFGRLVLAKEVKAQPGGDAAVVDLGSLEPGGYAARAHVGDGPAARLDFACERGGDEWADSRADEQRLRAIARATGGHFVAAEHADRLSMPRPTQVALERRVMPVLPAWAWSLLAAASLGMHWIARRRSGLV